MNKFDKKLRKKATEEKIIIPENVNTAIENTLNSLSEKSIKTKRIKLLPRITAVAACFLFFMLFVMPNVSVTYAQSFENVPILSDIIRVVTIRNYFYSDDYHEMDVNIPMVDDNENPDAAKNINNDISVLTERIVKEFYQEVEEIGTEGHGSVYVDYDVITNTENWFTLKLTVASVRGSGSVYFKYYHIDRTTGKNVYLSDLFKNTDYNRIITENIKKQMRQQVKEDSHLAYWIDNNTLAYDFAEIGDKHNYYFNDNGDLVIPFDKYEIAPGYMGHPEFVIEKKEINKVLKDKYLNMFK